eukprot:2132423-Rhodomonas_salina.2
MAIVWYGDVACEGCWYAVPVLRGVQCPVLRGVQCPVLRCAVSGTSRYAVPGTERRVRWYQSVVKAIGEQKESVRELSRCLHNPRNQTQFKPFLVTQSTEAYLQCKLLAGALRMLYAMSGTSVVFAATAAMSGTTWGKLLRMRYAMSGTDVEYAAIREVEQASKVRAEAPPPPPPTTITLPGSKIPTPCPVLTFRIALLLFWRIALPLPSQGITLPAPYTLTASKAIIEAVQSKIGDLVRAYARATRCPVLTEGRRGSRVLRACYAISGTDSAYGATRRRTLWAQQPSARRQPRMWYAPLPPYTRATRCPVLAQRRLPYPLAMFSSGLAYAAVALRACDEMSGTDIADAATRTRP